jgi:hypothetical protein
MSNPLAADFVIAGSTRNPGWRANMHGSRIKSGMTAGIPGTKAGIPETKAGIPETKAGIPETKSRDG